MKLDNRFFPRVWDGEKYWYPCFSELGITYQCDKLPFNEDNIMDLDWALGWRFAKDGDRLEFDHIVESCTGMQDKNGKDIYENDVVKFPDERCFLSIWKQATASFGFEVPKNMSICSYEIEVVGNVHQNADLLDETN